MGRITPYHGMEIEDPRRGITKKADAMQRLGAQACQVGAGVRLRVPDNALISRLDWEEFKLRVERAFNDDSNIPCKDPLW